VWLPLKVLLGIYANLADIAYIDNFEFLEVPLAEEDEQLMEETEITLRESKQIN
jgi:hypothetical protein